MNIYIYGTTNFKSKIQSILTKANLGLKIENINTILKIKTTIEASPKDIFIIDESKILKTNFFTTKLRFLYSSESIEREFIDKYGIGDVCFNSINSMISYIQSRINAESKLSKNDLIEKIENDYNPFASHSFKNSYGNDDHQEKILNDSNKVTEESLEGKTISQEIEKRDLLLIKDINELSENDIENDMFSDLKI